MTAAQPQSLDRQGVPSLEVRWILRGQLGAAVTGWFERFPAETVALQDAYLLDPYLPGCRSRCANGGRWRSRCTVAAPGSWRWQASPRPP